MMDIFAVLDQVRERLQQQGRITYRILKMQFQLDDETLEALKDELLFSYPEISEVDGRGLVWNGEQPVVSGQHPVISSSSVTEPRPPVSYTPTHLAERIRAEQAAMESRGSRDGERKTITALFADLKGSTALIEGLDPEDARAVIDPALQLMMDAVHRYEGYVAQALGDGIFALFGAPIAHEDHPQRALYAALRMQEEMRTYGDQVRLKHGVPLQMRVGINTGEVVVRSIRKDDLHTDYVPVGHSTNLAARMEQMANPGSIVISEYTRKLTEGYFELKALGAATIKGVEEPLNIYEVLGAGPLRTRFQVTARRGLSRFVGRQSEMEQLQRALEQAKAGHGQIVGVMGEPGLGKSRLFYEFKLTSQSGCLIFEAFSVSYGKASPYLPLTELLKEYFQIEPTDDERQQKSKVVGHVLTLDRNLEDTLPYLFSLLGIEDPESSLPQVDAQIRRQRTFAALKKLFLRESLDQPLILLFEDLHWIDSETQGFLDTLSESVASAPLLLLVNYRPEYRHEWGTKTYYTQLRLTSLGRAEAEELLSFLLGTDPSLTALKSLILEKTEGTPFFMEEVVQTLVEEGAFNGERGNYRLETTPTELHISPTVQGVLAARIDRLTAEEKVLLQQLSVIGRQFPLSLVKQVVSHSEADLHRLLSSLQTKEFLYEQPAFPEIEYLFKHALTQDVAYGTVLQEQRKALHERTGKAIETLYTDSLETHYSELAHHYHQSENAEKAVTYLHLAGQRAVQRSADSEAVQLLTTALEKLQTWPDMSERTQQELELLLTLGPALIADKGWAAPEVKTTYCRARDLCQQAGDAVQLHAALWGLWTVYLAQAEHEVTYESAQQLLHHAQSGQDSGSLLAAFRAMGESEVWRGEFESARTHLEESIALYDPQQHPKLVFRYGEALEVTSRCVLAWCLWYLGYPDQAVKRSMEAFALAREGSHVFSVLYAQAMTAFVHQYRREAQLAKEWAEAGLTLSNEQGSETLVPWLTIVGGSVLAEKGHVADGISRLREGLTAWRASGTEGWQSYWLALLAEAYRAGGQVAEGLSVVAEAEAFVEKTGERWCEAELYRLKGELTLQLGTRDWGLGAGSSSPQVANLKPQILSEVAQEAEEYFLKAIDIARRQEAKSWELRAATSLARLCQSQGKTTEARDLLAPVYNWFTEGFDTPDLKDAKALLEQLS